MITVKTNTNIKIPRVPNFILCTNAAGALNGKKLPLSAFDEAGLREIGERWTIDLINRAEEQGEVVRSNI